SAVAALSASSARTLNRDNDELLVGRDGAAADRVAQHAGVARGAFDREAARIRLENRRGARGVARHQHQPHALVRAGEKVRLAMRGLAVEGEGGAEVAPLLGDAREEVVAKTELRRRHLRDGAERRFCGRVVLVELADADEEEGL